MLVSPVSCQKSSSAEHMKLANQKIANQTAQKDTGHMVILILLNSFIEKESSIPFAIQFSVFYGCSAEKSVIGVQLFKEIEMSPENSVISFF
jgi:hypothetical protein